MVEIALQRVIVRHQTLRACVAEQFAGLTIRSAHRSHLCLETAAENQIDTGSGKGFFRSLLNAPRTSRARGAVRLVYANGREIGAVARARVAKTNLFMGRNPTRQAD